MKVIIISISSSNDKYPQLRFLEILLKSPWGIYSTKYFENNVFQCKAYGYIREECSTLFRQRSIESIRCKLAT